MAPARSSPSDGDRKKESKPTLTPPASEEADKHNDSGSDLSDLDAEPEENGEIVPDHYYDGGKIPVFKPVSQSRVPLLVGVILCRLAWLEYRMGPWVVLMMKSLV